MSEQQHIRRTTDEHAADRPLPAAVGIRSQRQSARFVPLPHSHRFVAISAVLIVAAIAGITALVAQVARNNDGGFTGPWSSWSPVDTGTQGASEIANHIGPFYRLSGVNQLAVVSVINLGNPNAVNSSTGGASGLQVAIPTSQGLSLLGGNTIAYNLCGVGSTNCSIGTGKPSSDRLLLLRREALELALYTFKYISGTDNVVAVLPPARTTTGCIGLCSTPHSTKTQRIDVALVFDHQEMQPLLDQPLSASLPLQIPPTLAQMSLWKKTEEAALVDQLTARSMFSEQIENAQDGSNIMVLSQLPAS
jgi:hypothetical protein